jgi:small-conductance mechanosensitive channel
VNYVKTLQDQVQAMAKGVVQQVPTLTIALVVLIVTWILAKFAVQIADRLTRRTHIRENLKQLVETLVRLAIWVFGLLIAATIAMPGLTPASLFAGLGIGALAIGFAFQDIFQNFLAGVLIMVRDRMRIGDTIECQGITGKVERITLRETHIRAPSNELTIVPNSVLFKNPVRVTTDRPQRRFELVVGVTSDSDLDQAAAVIRSAVEGIDDIVKDRPVEVFAQEFKTGEVDFLVRWWSGARPKDLTLKDAVVREIKRSLDEARIAMPGTSPPPRAANAPAG